jgi:hypothetical protein
LFVLHSFLYTKSSTSTISDILHQAKADPPEQGLGQSMFCHNKSQQVNLS